MSEITGASNTTQHYTREFGHGCPFVVTCCVYRRGIESRMSHHESSTQRARARRVVAPCPAEVRLETWHALAASLLCALREKTARGAAPACVLVFQIVLELRAAGTSWDRVETIVLQALNEHPELGALDRFDVVSGKQTSDVLRSGMLGWVHRARQVDAPTAPQRG